MRVLICGSRTWNRISEIAAVIDKLPTGTVIIHGAAKGADSIADACAQVAGLPILKFPVTDEDWAKIGKSAGPRRNKKMLDEGQPNVVIAFLDENSETNGTNHMIQLAESYGVRVVIIKKPCFVDSCSTCHEPYSNPPTERSRYCSNNYHCCRTCEWETSQEGGFAAKKLVRLCETCEQQFG